MPRAVKPPLHQLLFLGIGILAIQGTLMLALARVEYLPSPPPLSEFPFSIASWEATRTIELEPEVLNMLMPDDVLNREYSTRDGGSGLSLFVAYYKAQHNAGGAHDPKVCLPGSGWNPLISETIQVSVPQSSASFPANYYVIAKDSQKAVVLYWYQTYNRIVTQEQVFRLNRLIDTVKDHRSDMALVRIVVPVEEGDLAAARDRATQFAQSLYPFLRRQFPAKT